jgi:hypothetical protein
MSPIAAIGAVAGPPAPLAAITATDRPQAGAAQRSLVRRGDRQGHQPHRRSAVPRPATGVQAASGDPDAQDTWPPPLRLPGPPSSRRDSQQGVDAFNEIMRMQDES